MRLCKKCLVQKDLSEFAKARTRKDGYQTNCRQCAREYYAANREHALAVQARRTAMFPARVKSQKQTSLAATPIEVKKARALADFIKHREARSAKNRKFAQDNPEKVRAYTKKWNDANPGKRKAVEAKYWAANMDKQRAKNNRRRAVKMNATPAWANHTKINEFYTSAEALNMLLGEWHHVDHIVPLRSPFVCGLHNEFNLQILQELENLRKGNRHWPDMPTTL